MINRYYHRFPRTLVTEEEISASLRFGSKVVETTKEKHQSRMQFNQQKSAMDHAYGAMAEFAVSRLLGTTLPDLTIYDVRDKSYEHDLVRIADDKQIWVKTTHPESLWHRSWMFNRDDPTLRDGKKLYVFGHIEHEADHGLWFILLRFIAVSSFVQHLTDPALARLAETKYALNDDTLGGERTW